MFESKFDIRMFCVHILYKLFQLLIIIKGDKNNINIPPVNVRKKSCGPSECHFFSEWQRNALAKVGPSGDPMATPSNWQFYLRRL